MFLEEISALLRMEDGGDFAAAVRGVMTEGSPFMNRRCRSTAGDAGERILSLNGVPLRLTGAEGAVFTLEDITEVVAAEERKRLRLWLKDYRLRIVAHRPLAEAIVTAGGVDTREIDPRDRRSSVVSITPAARDMLAEDRRRRDEWLADRLAALDPDTQAALVHLIPVLEDLAS